MGRPTTARNRFQRRSVSAPGVSRLKGVKDENGPLRQFEDVAQNGPSVALQTVLGEVEQCIAAIAGDVEENDNTDALQQANDELLSAQVNVRKQQRLCEPSLLGHKNRCDGAVSKLPRPQVTFRVESKWPLIRDVCEGFPGWRRAVLGDEEYELLWTDTPISVERFSKLRPYQKCNHFLGMSTITWKHSLCQNMLRMKAVLPEAYGFFPDAFELPDEIAKFKQASEKRETIYICKPTSSACGRGIFLTRGFSKISPDLPEKFVAQRYLDKPYLLENHKFDLRLYVLVLDCNPLRLYLHREGLVRLATEEYHEPTVSNLKNVKMHLTNYSINADSPDFVENSDPQDGLDGHKRSFRAVLPELKKLGCDADTVLHETEELIVKTLLAVQPRLAYMRDKYQQNPSGESTAFEVLGFDVMIDENEKPWLLEVNHAPSFQNHTELDHLVKHQVVNEALSLLELSTVTKQRYKRRLQEELRDRAMGVKRTQPLGATVSPQESAPDWSAREARLRTGYKRLYPSSCPDRAAQHEQYLGVAREMWAASCGPASMDNKRRIAAARRGAVAMVSSARAIAAHTASVKPDVAIGRPVSAPAQRGLPPDRGKRTNGGVGGLIRSASASMSKTNSSGRAKPIRTAT